MCYERVIQVLKLTFAGFVVGGLAFLVESLQTLNQEGKAPSNEALNSSLQDLHNAFIIIFF